MCFQYERQGTKWGRKCISAGSAVDMGAVVVELFTLITLLLMPTACQNDSDPLRAPSLL